MDLLFRRSKKEQWSAFPFFISFLFFFGVLISYEYSLFFVFCFFYLHIRPVSALFFYCLLFNVWTGFPVHLSIFCYCIDLFHFPPASHAAFLISSPCFNAWMAKKDLPSLSFCFFFASYYCGLIMTENPGYCVHSMFSPLSIWASCVSFVYYFKIDLYL